MPDGMSLLEKIALSVILTGIVIMSVLSVCSSASEDERREQTFDDEE
jgi:hypothetical protein